MKRARSAEEFSRLIRPAGLSVVFRRSAEHGGRIYGVTFIDHNGGLVVNASKLDRGFGANRFHELFDLPLQELYPHKPQPRQPTSEDDSGSLRQQHGGSWDELHVPDLLSELLDEAARPDEWEQWYLFPKKRRKRR